MKKILLLMAVSLSLNACIIDDSVDPVGIDVITIARGALGTNEDEPILKGAYLVNSSEEWTAMKTKISKFSTVSYSETAIDFDAFQVLAYFDTIQTPKERYYNLYILGISEFNGTRSFGLQRNTLDTHFNTFEQPFHIVKVGRSELPYNLEEQE